MGAGVADGWVGRVQVGAVGVDPLTLDQAIARVDRLIGSGRGGAVFTARAEQVILAEEDPRLTQAYLWADLALLEAGPLALAARLLGNPIPPRITTRALVDALIRRALANKSRVYLLGGQDGEARLAAQRLREWGVEVVGAENPWIEDPTRERMVAPLATAIRDTGANLVLVALEPAREELFIQTARRWATGAVMVGVGPSFELLAGEAADPAPRWLCRLRLGWVHRWFGPERPPWRKLARIVRRQRREAKRRPALPAIS